MSYDEDALKKELIRDEGKRLTPYRDSLGYWTVGVGHLLVRDELARFINPDTGRPRKSLTEAECADLLMGDIVDAENNLNRILPGWRALDDVRQRAMLNLSFNLGSRLGKFRRTLAAIEEGRWEDAGDSLRASLWWKQVKSRGPRIVHMIVTGKPWRGTRAGEGGDDGMVLVGVLVDRNREALARQTADEGGDDGMVLVGALVDRNREALARQTADEGGDDAA